MNSIDIYDIGTWAKNSVFLYPLILSLLSALIFWLVFSYAPYFLRRNKIRPLVELDIINVRGELFAIFDCIMGHAKHSASHFQSEIRSGRLSEHDIKLGLQNKCLNEHYLYNEAINTRMLVVGAIIGRHANTVDRLVDKAFNFSQFVKADEIILLECIRENVRRYDFGDEEIRKNPTTRIGGNVFRPVVPNISYRCENFSELYLLYLDLQEVVIKNFKYLDRNSILYNVQYLYGRGQYKDCITYTHQHLKALPKDKAFLWNYIAACLYKIGARKAAYKELYYIYRDGGSLVSSRSFLEPFLNDQEAIDILLQSHTNEEFEMLKKTFEEEEKIRSNYLESNNSLLQHFERLKFDS